MQDLTRSIVDPYLEGMTILGLVDRSEDRLVDPEAHGGGNQSQGQVADHTGIIRRMIIFVFPGELSKSSHLMREIYLTARRQTRTEPQMMPESLGLSQYRREFIWSGVSHILIVNTEIFILRT